MSAAARKAGQKLAQTIATHTREAAAKAVERRANDIGEVIKSDGKGRVEVLLPGVGVVMTETDLYFLVDPSSLSVGEMVAVMAVDNEYMVIGPAESDAGAVANRGTAKGCVVHGTNAKAPRPKGYPSVEWIGTVEPLNAEEFDTWSKP